MNFWAEMGIGFVLLAAGGELVVRGAVDVARRFGVSELLIGLTLVGFGTSTPELTTSVSAALRDADGVAVGNVIGSNIADILLIAGVGALLAPIVVRRVTLIRDGLALLLVSIGLAAYAYHESGLRSTIAYLMLGGLALYILVSWLTERRATSPAPPEAEAPKTRQVSVLLAMVFAAGGIALLIFGADYLVRGATAFARTIGMSETVIGLTIVAIGTSLPELFTTIVAVTRGRGDVAFGNVIGSCIYNVLGVLGFTAAVRPIVFPSDLNVVDWTVFVASAVVLVVFATTHRRIARWEGLAMVLAYAGYIAYLATRSSMV